MIENAFAKIEKWFDKNGIIFDPDKFELIHFLCKKCIFYLNIRLIPLILPRYNISKQVVKLIEKKTFMR